MDFCITFALYYYSNTPFTILTITLKIMSTTLWIILWVIAAVLVVVRTVWNSRINQNLGSIMTLVYFFVVTYGSEALFGCSFMVGLVITVISFLAIALPIKYFIDKPTQQTK